METKPLRPSGTQRGKEEAPTGVQAPAALSDGPSLPPQRVPVFAQQTDVRRQALRGHSRPLQSCSPRGGRTCLGFPGRGCRWLCVRGRARSGAWRGAKGGHEPAPGPQPPITHGLSSQPRHLRRPRRSLGFPHSLGLRTSSDPAPPLHPALGAARHRPRTVPSSPLLPLSPPPARPLLGLSSSHSYPPPAEARIPLTGLGRGRTAQPTARPTARRTTGALRPRPRLRPRPGLAPAPAQLGPASGSPQLRRGPTSRAHRDCTGRKALARVRHAPRSQPASSGLAAPPRARSRRGRPAASPKCRRGSGKSAGEWTLWGLIQTPHPRRTLPCPEMRSHGLACRRSRNHSLVCWPAAEFHLPSTLLGIVRVGLTT